MAISLISYLSIDMDKSLNVPVKNLLFFVHQNCLLIMKLVLNRLPPEALTNSWAKKLQTAADTKLSKQVSTTKQICQSLKQQQESAVSVIKNIQKLKPSKFIQDVILSLIQEIEFIPLMRVREILYN